MENDRGFDFIAKLDFNTTEKGGRVTYAVSGYFPQIKFPFTKKETGGKMMFMDIEKVYPGEF